MNDDFLYELRNPPPPEFVARLKARLDLQANDAREQRRAIKWFVLGAMLMGGTALAFVSPSVRQAAWTMIVQLRGAPTLEADVVAEQAAVRPAASVQSSTSVTLETSNERSSTADAMASRDSQGPHPTATADTDRKTAVVWSPASSSGGTLLVGAQRSLPTIHIAHAKSLQTLADELEVDLAKRVETAQFDFVELPAESSPCGRSFHEKTVDVFISDRSLKGCPSDRRILEFPFAYDPLILVINRENTWARSISLNDLRKMRGGPSNPTTTWSQVRPEWPTLPLLSGGAWTPQQISAGKRLIEAFGYSPTAPLVVETFEPRTDDRATLAWVDTGISTLGAIEWRTLKQVLEERNWPTVVAVAGADGEAIEPTTQNIGKGRYPLARPIWIYVDRNRLHRYEVVSVMRRLLSDAPTGAIERSGFVAVAPEEREAALRALQQAMTNLKRY